MNSDENAVVDNLRAMAASGVSMVELVNFVHDVEGTPRYSRGIVLGWFTRAFGLKALDFTNIVFACKLFGDGASVGIPHTERQFHLRLIELGVIAVNHTDHS